MKKILVTGATGNIGVEVVRSLMLSGTSNTVIAGVRNIEKSKALFSEYPSLQYNTFDFENPATFSAALDGVHTVFLLRPPHISDIPRYFAPLIQAMKEKNVSEVLFLSVQGAEKGSVIPHNKIEKLIRESGINHIFLRPSYFMQNLTTTLLEDIKFKRSIILPAGKAKFNWVDVNNIGETAALLLERFPDDKNQAIELTGYENENFEHVVKLMNEHLPSPITYRSVNPLRFYQLKKRDGAIPGMIIVMLLLHFLPRFQKEPAISHFYEQLTGKKPTSLVEFIMREKEMWG